MDQIGLRNILDADPRPSLVLDLEEDNAVPGQLRPAFVNKAIRANQIIYNQLTRVSDDAARLRAWIIAKEGSWLKTTHVGSHGYTWHAFVVAERWKIVQLTTGPLAPTDLATPSEEKHMSLPVHTKSLSSIESTEARTAFVITDEALEAAPGLDHHLDIIQACDWASTSLGPISSWPQDLVQIVHLILLNPSPQSLFLGDDHILLYNQAYAVFAGERHPSIMGQSLLTAWNEVAELNISIFTFIDSTGRPFIMDDFNISLNRTGFLEELYLKWTTIPIKGPLRGYLCTASEETANKVNVRRKALLTRISDACRGIRDMSTFWDTVLQTLGTDPKDFPFAFVYSRTLGHDGIYQLEGALDTDKPAEILPPGLNLATDDHMLVKPLRNAQEKFNPISISEDEGNLPSSIMALSEGRGLGDRCRHGLVCPIRRASDNITLGVLVIGLSTRKTFDTKDSAFVQYMMRSLGDLATNTINAQENDRLALQTASQHQTLIQALATSTLEATHMTEKFHSILRTMELVDVGVFEFDLKGRLLQANEAFFKLSGHSREIDAPEFSWKDVIYEEDAELTAKNWEMVANGKQANFEFRYKTRQTQYGDHKINGYWVQAVVVPVVDPNTGIVKTISGCVTDIMPSKLGQLEAIRKTEALQKLRESEQRFDRISENALCPIYRFDANNKLTFCNDAYYDMIGYTKHDHPETLDWQDLIYPDDLPQVLAIWEEGRRTKSPINQTCRLKRTAIQPDGRKVPVWIIASAYPEQDESGVITGWTGVALDVSQIKWGEKVQQERLQEITEAKAAQEAFIDMTSHEIRNPLGAVVHCADSILASLVDLEALAKDPDARLTTAQRENVMAVYDSTTDSINTIISCSTHQRRIVDDVLTFSKLNSDLLKITPSVVRPSAILSDIRNMFETDALKVGVSLTVKQEPSEATVVDPELVMLDPGRLLQVLINLITNALKFTREESTRDVTVTMVITAGKPSLDQMPVDFVPSSGKHKESRNDAEWGHGRDIYLYFLVKDTGCGLTEDEKSRMFARFSQGNPRTHTKYGGSGLGLFISRELVELQDGGIGFSSQAGVGSTFGFYIKAKVADSAKVDAAAPTLRSGRLSSSGATVSQRFSILVVEDNIVNQAVLSKQLRRLGHEVHVANNGIEALKFLQRTSAWQGPMDTPQIEVFPVIDATSFDSSSEHKTSRPSSSATSSTKSYTDSKINLSVILMDVEMPIMDGLTCATEIRRLQSQGMIGSHIPIIAVSANARSEQVGEALSCGMDDAICKPFRIVDLMPKIERMAA